MRRYSLAIIINTFGNRNLKYVVQSLKSITNLTNDIAVVLSWSNPPANSREIVEALSRELGLPVITLFLPRMGSAKQRDITLRFVTRHFPNIDYIVYVEDDVLISNEDWLYHLVRVMDSMPRNVALVSLERGSRLCLDFVVTPVMPAGRAYVALSRGSGAYIIRADVVKELIRLGLGTYSRFMYFHWEDAEFVLKLWFMGYRTVSYEIDGYRHIGLTSHDKPIYRRYTEYLDPLMAMIVNLPLRFAVLILLVRFLRDLVKAFVRSEAYLFLRAYLFIIAKLRLLIMHRRFRMSVYRNIDAFKSLIYKCIK